jgi:hypothetical protein
VCGVAQVPTIARSRERDLTWVGKIATNEPHNVTGFAFPLCATCIDEKDMFPNGMGTDAI